MKTLQGWGGLFLQGSHEAIVHRQILECSIDSTREDCFDAKQKGHRARAM